MNNFAFVNCRTVDEALGQLSAGAVVKAGGIDLLDLMKDEIVAPSKLVNIRNVESLRGIDLSKDGLRLGPLTTLSEIADIREFNCLTRLWPMLRVMPLPRRFAIWPPWAATLCSVRAAGTSARATSIARRRAAPVMSAMPTTGRINTTLCSITEPAQWCIHHPPRFLCLV